MNDLATLTTQIQAEVDVERDGIYGLETAAAVLGALKARRPQPDPSPGADADAPGALDARTEAVIATLDPKARPMFRKFMGLAKASAATHGLEYILINGHRTWAQQDALYAQGRTLPGPICTYARGGQGNHNFEIAADAGVFQDGRYLDDANPTLAEKIHHECAKFALQCGLESGANWKLDDDPHYQVKTNLSIAEKRSLYETKGSVL